MNKIPSLNLKDFTQGGEQKRIQFVKDLGKAYEEIGFVAISGHFLSESGNQLAAFYGVLPHPVCGSKIDPRALIRFHLHALRILATALGCLRIRILRGDGTIRRKHMDHWHQIISFRTHVGSTGLALHRSILGDDCFVPVHRRLPHGTDRKTSYPQRILCPDDFSCPPIVQSRGIFADLFLLW